MLDNINYSFYLLVYIEKESRQDISARAQCHFERPYSVHCSAQFIVECAYIVHCTFTVYW